MVGAVIVSVVDTAAVLQFNIFKSKLSILFMMTAGNAALRLLCTGCPWLEQVSEFSSGLFPFQDLLFHFL